MVRSKTKTTLFLLLLMCFTADAWWKRRHRPRPAVQRCIKPPTLTYGSVICSSYNHGATCHFRCDSGYSLLGSSSITCQEGLWRGSAPTCTVQKCIKPPTPTYGSVSCSSYYHGATCHFRCASGYSLLGSSSITCQKGLWKGSTPTCAVQRCINPPSPTYGSASCSSYYHGATCHFRCANGYSLLGSSSITCQEGLWKGSTPTCAVRRCPVIVPPENALPSNCGGTPGNLATFGSVCTFYCPHGFNPSGHNKVECQADGTWSEASFACEVEFETDGEIFEAGLTDQTDQGNGNSGSGSGLDNFEWDLTDQDSGSSLGIINKDFSDDGSGSEREISDADITEQGSVIVLEDEREDGLGDHNTEHESDIYFVK